MKIRLFRQKDFDKGLLECLNALSETKFTEWWKIGHITGLRHESKVKTYVMVDEDQTVVGTYSIFIEPKFIHGGSYVGHIEDVCVHPDWQGQGIGKQLMEHALAECKAASCYKIVLYCSPEVQPFYEKLGFYHNGAGMRFDIDEVWD